MDVFSPVWGLVSMFYHGFIGIYHVNPWLAVGLMGLFFMVCFVGISWLMSLGEGALKIFAIICVITFIAVLTMVLWKEYGIGINLSNMLLNATNGTIPH